MVLTMCVVITTLGLALFLLQAPQYYDEIQTQIQQVRTEWRRLVCVPVCGCFCA